jgi:hypothetical protein
MFSNFPQKNKNKKMISTRFGVFVLVLLVLPAIILAPYFSGEQNFNVFSLNLSSIFGKNQQVEGDETSDIPIQNASMDIMKTKGCVADGLLSGYGADTQNEIDLVNRSNCVYLHRALETWGAVPNFTLAQNIMKKINKPNVIYGMFIAEDLNVKDDLYYPDEHRYFDFKDMCTQGTDNKWGEWTCTPSFDRKEYRKYVTYITEKAMDIGIRSFLFGQVFLQDDTSNPQIQQVISKMRDYARRNDMQIAIGAQTNAIVDTDYLKNFDYIEGGVGIDSQGNVESSPCWSRLGSCWALLWNNAFASKANNVILDLDWSGFTYDDMATFTKMDQPTRAKTLRNLYNYFTQKKIGFLMPFSAALNEKNNGCYGPSKGFYSPSDSYTCKDENAINSILK